MSKLTFRDLENEFEKITYEQLEVIRDIFKKIVKDGVKDLKETSPKSKMNKRASKRYAGGWTAKIGDDGLSAVIKNKNYRLVHLLEKGHRIVGHSKQGKPIKGFVEARPHVEKASEKIAKEIRKEFKEVLK